MIKITIGDQEMELSSIDEQWINQQINRRRKDGLAVCVRVTINQNGLNLALSTPACAGCGGGGRPPNANEKKIFDLWDELKLNDPEFTGGHVVAFLKRLRHML